MEREEQDSDAIQQFGQSMVDKMMSVLEAEAIYEKPSEAAPEACADDEEQEEVYKEQEDLPIYTRPEDVLSSPGLTKEEKAKFCFKNKVCTIVLSVIILFACTHLLSV